MNEKDENRLEYEPKSRGSRQTFTIVLASLAAIVIILGCSLYWYWNFEFGVALDITAGALALVGIPAGIYYGTQDKEYWQ